MLTLCRDHLILNRKYALVPWSASPDFCLYGASLVSGESLFDAQHRASLEMSQVSKVPTVLLSTSNMYRTGEECGVFSIGTRDKSALFSLSCEAMVHSNSLVIRPFNIYGPDVKQGVVHVFMHSAKKGLALPIRGNGYQVRSFLHQQDFLRQFDTLLGHRGVETIGSCAEPISVRRLADCVWRMYYGPAAVTPVLEKPHLLDYDSQSKLVQKSCETTISLRKGIWLMKGAS